MNKFLIGSSLLGLTNTKDTDYLYILEDNETVPQNDGSGEDLRYRTKVNILETLKFEGDDGRKLFNYQFDQQINPSFASYYSYNILDYKEELISFLKNIVKEKLYNFNKIIFQGNQCCCKMIYHIAYNLFIVENNSSLITSEQKQIIQEIHDLQKPIEYLDELATRINAL